jgi:uncharacterized protein YciI
MGGLLNRRTRFLDDDGAPVALGFHAVGDAHTCTNPLYGRGCSLAMVQATLLADALATHPDDPAARAVAYEEASGREIEPWYRAAVSQDRMARQQAARESSEERGFDDRDDAGPSSAEADPGSPFTPDQMQDLMRDGLLPAVRLHAVVFRAFIRAFNLLEAPDALLGDSEVIAKVLAVYQDRDSRPPEPRLGPPRAEMLAQLDAAA